MELRVNNQTVQVLGLTPTQYPKPANIQVLFPEVETCVNDRHWHISIGHKCMMRIDTVPGTTGIILYILYLSYVLGP